MSVEEPGAAAAGNSPSAASEPSAVAAAEPVATTQPERPPNVPARGAAQENAARRESLARNALIVYFPMFIATLSLITSIFNGYLNLQFVDLMQRNVSRGEYARTCREIITTFFEVKQKIGMLMPAPDRSNVVGASRVTENSRIDAQAAVAKFGGLGTYLANFQDDGTRTRYTELSRTLTAAVDNARTTPLADIDKLFAPADKLFATMNDDCVKLSRTMRM